MGTKSVRPRSAMIARIRSSIYFRWSYWGGSGQRSTGHHPTRYLLCSGSLPLCSKDGRRLQRTRGYCFLVGILHWLRTGRLPVSSQVLNSVLGVNVTFFPQHFLGLIGMPRRYTDYPDIMIPINRVRSSGSLMTLAGLILVVWHLYVRLASSSVRASTSIASREVGARSPSPIHLNCETPKSV